MLTCDGTGNPSDTSTIVAAVDPAAPSITAASVKINGTVPYVTLSWRPASIPRGDSLTYYVESSDQGGIYTVVASNIAAKTFTVNNLLPGVAYKFRVRAQVYEEEFSIKINIPTLFNAYFISYPEYCWNFQSLL